MVAALLLATASCEGGPVAPGGQVRISVEGAAAAEVGSEVSEGIIVQHLGADGLPAAGFEIVVTVPEQYGGGGVVFVRPAGDGGEFEHRAAVRTDRFGRARFDLRFLNTAGPAWLHVIDAAANIVDTLEFDVLPGPATRMVITPRDTAVLVGNTAQFRARTYDEFGNARPDSVFTWQLSGAGAEVVTPGVVRGLSHSRVQVRATAGGFTDSVGMSVVPAGRLFVARGADLNAGSPPPGAVFFDTDGSSGTAPIMSATCHNGLGWAGTSSLTLSLPTASSGCLYPRLYASTTSGTLTRVRADTVPFRAERMPQASADGAWIYFVGQTDHQNGELWRIRPNGLDADRIGPAAGYFDEAWFPSPSPTGDRVVYALSNTGSPAYLRIADVSTDSTWALGGFAGNRPRWNPVDDRIAFTRGDSVFVTDANGAPPTFLINGHSSFAYPPSWSPDGQWLAVISSVFGEGRIVLVHATSGLRLPLGFARNSGAVSWRPAP